MTSFTQRVLGIPNLAYDKSKDNSVYHIFDKKLNIDQDLYLILDEYFNIYIIYDILTYQSINLKLYNSNRISILLEY